MAKIYTAAQVAAYVKTLCHVAGGISAWARQNKLDSGNVSKAVEGKIKPGGRIGEAAGFKRIAVETYIRVGDTYVPPPGYAILSEKSGPPRTSHLVTEIKVPKKKKKAHK